MAEAGRNRLNKPEDQGFRKQPARKAGLRRNPPKSPTMTKVWKSPRACNGHSPQLRLLCIGLAGGLQGALAGEFYPEGLLLRMGDLGAALGD